MGTIMFTVLISTCYVDIPSVLKYNKFWLDGTYPITTNMDKKKYHSLVPMCRIMFGTTYTRFGTYDIMLMPSWYIGIIT